MTDNIKKLSDYSHARLRTEMYLGSRSLHTQEIISYVDNQPILKEFSWTPAAYTAFREIIDNSLDEMIGHGYGNRLDVEYDENKRTFSVKDNGRGIPIDWDETEGMHKATMVLSNARAGRNFDERKQVAGTNGIGASIVNFCSEYFELTIQRNNQRFYQKFIEGDTSLQIDAPKIKEVKSEDTFTKIDFKLSNHVFGDYVLPEQFVKDRMFEIALYNPTLTVYFNGSKIKVGGTIDKTLFGKNQIMKFAIHDENFYSTFYIKPKFTDHSEYMFSYVNNIPAFNGGSHMDMFRKLFISGVLDALAKEGKKRKLTLARSDISDGLLILNHTNMFAPNFDSQSKTRLINEEPAKIINAFFSDGNQLKSILKKNREWVDEIFERCAERTNKKDAAELDKANKKVAKKKIAKLRDATSNNRQECILILAEGDSAISGSAAVRNPKIHAGLPLRGKILNVNGEDPKKVLDNKELSDIMSAIGLFINKKVDRNDLRYGQIWVARDEDEDGKNIAALLINFFHSYWPELFNSKEKPFISIFMTPFIIAQKGKERKYWYSNNYHEFDSNDYKGWAITRAKGLGSLEEKDWEYSLAEPKLFPIVDDGKMKESLDLIFNGNRSDDRKDWLGLN